jgi:hypothetical protein
MNSGNAMEFVKGCLRSQPSSAQLLDVIAKAKADKKCDVAQRLYAYKRSLATAKWRCATPRNMTRNLPRRGMFQP